MKLSHLKNIIRKTIKEANLLTETHQCNCPQNAINPTTCTNPCAGGCCPGGTDWEGEVALDTSTDPIGTGDFTPDFAKNMPRAINVRPTTLTEDKNTTMKLSRLKQIIKEEVKRLNEASRAQRPDWFPPHPDVPYGEYGHMPLEGVKVKPKEGQGPPCCCEEKFDPWSSSWDCLQMGTAPEQCCNAKQQCTGGKTPMGEDVKIKPREDVEQCCCHVFYNSECGWDCAPGAIWHTNCCPSKSGMVIPPSGPAEPMGRPMG